jgi:DNA-directed RNA polymerase subunit alpha
VSLLKKQWDYLIKPYKLAFSQTQDPQTKETMIVEPLEKGFGHTLGNALRRVLLSSIEGAAVTSVKISGALLEFSAIPGVCEDITDIVLNLKRLSVKLIGFQESTAVLSAKGPGPVTAEALSGPGITVLNPDLIICNLEPGANIEMHMVISKGKGYVPVTPSSVYHRKSIGEISLDAFFSPVKKVSYEVESSRVGQNTDYDRLLLTVETDGSISPKEAISNSACILKDQLSQFVSFTEEEFRKENASQADSATSQAPFPPVFLKNVKDLELSVRCLNCLQNEGIVYVGDLVKKKESDLMRTPNFGRKSLNDINDVLNRLGLSLGMEVPGWPPQDIEQYIKNIQQDSEEVRT